MALASPHECIPTATFNKKFKLHVGSEDLRKVGVNSLEFTPDSLKLGGQLCLVNGVVYPDFSKPSSVSAGSTHPSLPPRKRPSSTVTSSATSELGTPITPKVRVIQATDQVHASVPAAPTSEREAPQGQRVRFELPDNDLQVSSQPEPEVTPVEPPPTKSSKSPVNPTVWDRINSLGAISITPVDSSPQRAVVTDDDAPPSPLEPGLVDILKRYQYLWTKK